MDNIVKIRFYGHSFFTVTSAEGLTIAMDPYNEQVKSPLPDVSADIALVSHQHFDHNNISLFKQTPEIVLKNAGNYIEKDVKITGFSSFHDKSGGSARGENIIFSFIVNNISFAHLGDLGTTPDKTTVSELKNIDIIFIPIGGVYTINFAEAFDLIKLIGPKIAVPMHFKEAKTKIDIDGISHFKSLASSEMVFKEFQKEFSLKKDALPSQTEIWAVYSS